MIDDDRAKFAVKELSVVVDGKVYFSVDALEQVGLGIIDAVAEVDPSVEEDWSKGVIMAWSTYQEIVETLLYENAAAITPNDISELTEE